MVSTYLLLWNPTKWPWKALAHDVEQVRRKGFVDDVWSCGNTKKIKRDDRVFLLRTHVAPRGIMASGIVTRRPFMRPRPEWNPSLRKNTALAIGVRFYSLFHPEHDGILPIAELQTENLARFPWGTRSGGISIPPPAAAELEASWSGFLMAQGQKPTSFPDEVTTPAQFFEGATRQISVNIYERSPTARQKCIDHYKCRCAVCEFDFEQVFGELGRGFIHVHHLKPLSEIRQEYEIDPLDDLRPICPNCHAMIHRNPQMMSIEDLKRLVQRLKNSESPKMA
jgi:5-methylcytosine-specific restriction protein A